MSLVVILGMHRSGTSFLTRSLHEAGCYLGTDLFVDSSRDNLEGHWEHKEAVRINERLLRLSGGSWSAVPGELRSDPKTEDRMAAFVRSLKQHRAAGWKDPRTTVTFPLWKPHLTDYRLVAALRHPMSVARSLQVRNGIPIERGLRLWAAYNERLSQHVAAARDVLWFDFDAPPEHVATSIRRICQALGLEWNERVEAVFNPCLRHHDKPAAIPDPAVEELYRSLRRSAGADESPDGSCTSSRSDSEAASLGDVVNRLGARLEQLARAQALQDANQQKIERVYLERFQGLSDELSKLHQGLVNLNGGICDLREDLSRVRQRVSHVEAEVQSCTEYLVRIQQSLPYRLARAASRLLQRTVAVVRFTAPPEEQPNSTPSTGEQDQTQRHAA